MEAGEIVKDVLQDYPELEEEDIKQALEYAAWTASERSIPLGP